MTKTYEIKAIFTIHKKTGDENTFVVKNKKGTACRHVKCPSGLEFNKKNIMDHITKTLNLKKETLFLSGIVENKISGKTEW